MSRPSTGRHATSGVPPGSGPSVPPAWPYLLACAAAALCATSGTIHRDQHGDSLLAVLNSLQRWTPFMWEQDRFGMLVPLLTLPIRSPLANMMAQGFLTIFSGLAVFHLLPRYFLRDASYPIAGTLGAASFLALTPPYYRFEYFIDTSYGTSLALALGGLILLERDRSRGRLAAALAMLGLANWVNSTTSLVLAPALVAKAALDFGRLPRRPRLHWPTSVDATFAAIVGLLRRAWRVEAVRSMAALGFGHEVGVLATSFVPDGAQATSYRTEPVALWPSAWGELAANTRDALAPPYWPLAIAAGAVLGAAWCVRRGNRVESAPARNAALALAATAAALAFLVGTKYWVRINIYAFRYLFTSALLAQAAAWGLAAAPLHAWLGRKGVRPATIPAAAAAVLLAATVGDYGWPSPARVRRDVDRRFGALTDDLLAAGCTHLAGDYWAVWPAVFHASLAHHERGDGRMTWGVTFRSTPTHAMWKEIPRESIRIGIARGDTMANTYLGGYRLTPLIEVEERPSLRVVRPAPLRPPAPAPTQPIAPAR